MSKKCILFFSIMFSSCATIYNSGPQTIHVKSAQGLKGIAIEVDGSSPHSDTLPATVREVPATWTELDIKVTEKCYEPAVKRVNRTITPSYYANIFNLEVGALVDYMTGAMWKFEPNVIIDTKKIAGCK